MHTQIEPTAGKPISRLHPMLLYALTISLSAFLLFEVEPIIAKIILPWFGGSAAVWATCLFFFQLELLLGYLYAHALIKFLSAKMQARLHVFMLAASLLLPILPHQAWKPSGSEYPAIRILLILAATVGLPYFLLSASSPLLQAWYARERPESKPYRLFSLSNAGSMLALLSYPVLVEPTFSARHQAIGWSAAYAGVGMLCAVLALHFRGGTAGPGRRAQAMAPQPGSTAHRLPNRISGAEQSSTIVRADARTQSAAFPTRKLQLLWVALAACASALLLSVTNHLSQNVAAVPFLWVVPLSLYLLSFILCFQGGNLYRRRFFLKLFAVALGGMAYGLAPEFVNSSLYVLVPLYCVGLFVACMVCHGELERLKPLPQHLTLFYLMVALGGAVGGMFVGLLAPAIFRGYFELPVALGASALVITLAVLRDSPFPVDQVGRKVPWLSLGAGCGAFIFCLGLQVQHQISGARVMVRNFYGSLLVTDTDKPDAQHAHRRLMNGTIQHGSQLLAAERRRLPTTYYGPESGVAIALADAGRRSSIGAGIIGVGAGTLAAYGRPGDRYTFYDINPLVVRIANSWFTFLKDSRARVDIILGDARLSLERQPPQNFNVLAVDAFTSDSIPVHLLTREAFVLYFRHLAPGGVLAIHISNKYLNLEPVVRGVAESVGKHVAVIESGKNEDQGIFLATWVLVTEDAGFLESRGIQKALTPSEYGLKPLLWTDDYSNLFRILK